MTYMRAHSLRAGDVLECGDVILSAEVSADRVHVTLSTMTSEGRTDYTVSAIQEENVVRHVRHVELIGRAVNCVGTFGRWYVTDVQGDSVTLVADSPTGIRYRTATVADLSNVSERPALDPR